MKFYILRLAYIRHHFCIIDIYYYTIILKMKNKQKIHFLVINKTFAD